MTRMRIMGLSLVAVFALTAVFAAGAFGKSTPLTLKTAKGPLPAGSEITASSSDLIFVTEAGNLECSSNILKGTLTNNGSSKDKGSITSESSTGGEPGGSCKTTTPFGPAAIVSSHLPWSVEFSNKGVATVKGKKVTFTSTFIGAPGEPKCTYESAKVLSTFSTAGGPITLTTSKQVFKSNKKLSNPACPATGELSGHFSLTSGGETVED